ncbi:MAG TPA: hypothetical protein VM432_12380 [Bdellovibrionales bacterium]|nr:hypothetical protein [Bdellovibrionales bacterium]
MIRLTCEKAISKNSVRQNESGQIVVEYVLLLLVAVSIAAVITRSMISSDPDSPGFVISAWTALLNEIGADRADDVQR